LKFMLDIKHQALDNIDMKSVVSSRGQITLPAEVRRALGLAAGTPVTLELVPGAVLLRKGGAGTHPVDRIYGALGPGVRGKGRR
jgi:AbrB family looped-hinge helix DNA binding protein